MSDKYNAYVRIDNDWEQFGDEPSSDVSVPTTTSADEGKFLSVDANGHPVWVNVPQAEDLSF